MRRLSSGSLAGLRPSSREQRAEVVLVGHAWQALEDPFEVGEGILAVTADLLDEGVDDGAAPPGLLVADEHPVFHAELGRTDGVLGEIVVELDLPVEEARLEARPLAGGIGEGFAEQAAGRDLPPIPEVSDQTAELVIVPSRLKPAGFLAFQRAGACSRNRVSIR